MKNQDIKFFKLFLIIFAASLAWLFLPDSSGLSKQALHMLIIFIASMAGIMLEVCKPVACLLISMAIATLFGIIDVKQGFTGFSNTVPWLLFLVLSLSKVITKTTLGLRLAYLFMKCFGKGILGLSYSITLTELLVSPILPSNTARGASVGFPLVTSLSQYISSKIKGVSEKSVGSYLSLLYAYNSAICSGMFLTAMISNAIIVESASNIGIQLTWLSWAKYMFIPCLIILLILPFILRILCNPKIKDLGDIKKEAEKNYKDLGALTSKEKFIISVFVGMLILWIFGDSIGVSVMTTTLLGCSIFILSGILDIKEMLSCYSTFSAVMMLGILISYVNCLISFGAIDWFNGLISGTLVGLEKNLAFILLSLIYYFTHYFFSGEGARIIALYVPFLATGVALGVDKIVVVMTLAFFSSASDVLTHYGCPVAITMFSSGYISAKKWVFCGIITALVIMAIWFSYIAFWIN